MRKVQLRMIRILGIAFIFGAILSGCKKDSVEPDKKDDKKEEPELSDIKMIDGGRYHTMLLKTDGTLWATGKNDKGQLGTNDNTDRLAFKKVLTEVKEVACGYEHTLVLKEDGSLWVTGLNEKGQLGTLNYDNINSFKKVLEDIKDIDAGNHHSIALTKDNVVMVTGANEKGQLSAITTYNYWEFVEAKSPKAISVGAGGLHSFIIDENNDLWGSGANFNGQLGDFDYEDQGEFKKIMSDVAEIRSGYTYTMAILSDGSFWVTGLGYYGPPGLKGKSEFEERTEFNVTHFSSGDKHYLIVSDNSLWGVGANQGGQLGLEKDDNTDFTKIVDGNVSRVYTGFSTSWYIDTEGKLWATGTNENGELGIGDKENRTKFEQIEL